MRRHDATACPPGAGANHRRAAWLLPRLIAALAMAIALVTSGQPGRMPPAHAAAPGNDDFDSAIVITAAPFTDAASTVEATWASDDPCTRANPTVWYRFTPTANSVVTADTFGSDYGTTLFVLTGTRGSLQYVTAAYTQVTFTAAAGTTYHFMLGSDCYSAGGGLVFNVSQVTPPPNDDFDDATVIPDLPYTDEVDAGNATRAWDDPWGNMTLWYAYTPAADELIVADTFGSDYDTVLGVYTGVRGNLTWIASSDDYGGLQSQVTFTATAGTTYYFLAGAYGSYAGHLQFHVRRLVRLVVSATINPEGTVDTKTGVATIRGTLTTNKPASAQFGGFQRQPLGRVTIRGCSGYPAVQLQADGQATWTLTMTPQNGRYGGGKAEVCVGGEAYDPEVGQSVAFTASASVQLRGPKK